MTLSQNVHTQTPTSQNITIMRSKNLQFCAFFTRCYTTCISACNVARVLHFLCTHHAHVMHMWCTSRVSSANHMTHHMIHHNYFILRKNHQFTICWLDDFTSDVIFLSLPLFTHFFKSVFISFLLIRCMWSLFSLPVSAIVFLFRHVCGDRGYLRPETAQAWHQTRRLESRLDSGMFSKV